jgi:hypothetical protein
MGIITERNLEIFDTEEMFADYYKSVSEKEEQYRVFKNEKTNKAREEKRLIDEKEKLKYSVEEEDLIHKICQLLKSDEIKDDFINVLIFGTREGHFALGFIELFKIIFMEEEVSDYRFYFAYNEKLISDIVKNEIKEKFDDIVTAIPCDECNKHETDRDNITGLLSGGNIKEKIFHLIITFDYLHSFPTETVNNISKLYYDFLHEKGIWLVGWKNYDHGWFGKGAHIADDKRDGNIVTKIYDSRGFRPVRYIDPFNEEIIRYYFEFCDQEKYETKISIKNLELGLKTVDIDTENQKYSSCYSVSVLSKIEKNK